jgi:hypothetical protein
MLTRRYNTSEALRLPILLSLILHGLILLVLGYMLMDSEQQRIRESVIVEMVNAKKEQTPPLPRRITETRQSSISLKKFDDSLTKAQFSLKTIATPNISITQRTDSPKIASLTPSLTTEAKSFISHFDIPLPSNTARGANIAKSSDGFGKSNTQNDGRSTGLADGVNIFEVALYGIAHNIIGKNKTGKEDIVFLIDSSGSMEENISAVARYIVRMIEVFQDSKLDYTLGVVKFNRILKNNDIRVYSQTKDVNEFKSILRSIKCKGDESIFDALDVGFAQVKFRNSVDKTFILVTDEPIRARARQGGTPQGMTRKDLLQIDLQEVIQKSSEKGIKISAIAIEDDTHKILTNKTNGIFFPIPQE